MKKKFNKKRFNNKQNRKADRRKTSFSSKQTLKTIGIELVLLVGIVLLIMQVSPQASMTRTTGAASQEILEFKNAHAILIDDNQQFSSPTRLDGNETTLEPGKYYWKAIGLLGEEKTGNFTIDSKVVLNTNEGENVTQIQNVGNTPVNLTTKDGKIVTGGLIVNEGETKTFNRTNGTFLGRQK